MKKSICLLCLLSALFILSACQPTPSDAAVTNKAATDLKESINLSAAPTETASAVPAAVATKEEEKWTYEKDYDSGNRLIVDAVMVHTDAKQLPVLSIAPKMFESGDALKTITKIFVPDATIYDQGDQLTKSQLEQSIMDVKEEIFRIENDMIPFEGAKEPVPADRKAHEIENLQVMIDYYEEQIKTAPDDSELKEAEYKLRDVGDGSLQANMLASNGNAAYSISFVNWPPDRIGSAFYFESNKMVHENIGTTDQYVTSESLSGDAGYINAKERIDQCIKDMGIDYMSLSATCKGDNSYSFYYTRDFNGLQETYVNQHIGTSVTGVDYAAVIYLWEPEYLWFEVQNDQIVKVTWNNPSKIISVDNENVQTKPWEQIQEIFKKQMDFIMSPTPTIGDNPSNATYFFEKTQVYINRVELGFTKVLMKDSGDDYKLIPTWSFLGYEISKAHPERQGVNVGGEVCYVTINAIDGTVIDRGLMY